MFAVKSVVGGANNDDNNIAKRFDNMDGARGGIGINVILSTEFNFSTFKLWIESGSVFPHTKIPVWRKASAGYHESHGPYFSVIISEKIQI